MPEVALPVRAGGTSVFLFTVRVWGHTGALKGVSRTTDRSDAAAAHADAVREPDAGRRMLRILSGQLHSLANTLTAPLMKPTNPVVGELLVARCEAPEGEEVSWSAVVEQVSHHPPVSAVLVEGRALHPHARQRR